MSLTLSLRAALSGITATQTALQTVSSNIVNATTPGYTRKTVEFQTRTVNGVGAGVEIARVGRDVDEFLIGQVRTSTSAVGALQVRDEFLRQIESFFGTPADDSTITTGLSNLRNALEALATTPESDANRFTVINEARKLTTLFNDLSGAAQNLRLEADQEIGRVADILDEQFELVAELNLKITRANALDQPDGDLRDQRDRALAAIAEQMDIRTTENSEGQVTIFTAGGRTVVTGGIAEDMSHLSISHANASVGYIEPGDADYPGGIQGLFIGTPDTTNGSNDITGEIRDGRLKGLIDIRDEVLPNLQAELDRLASVLTTEINKVHNQGTALPPPSSLTGTQQFAGTDVLSMSGSVRVAVLDQDDGTVVETQDIALAGITTAADLVTALNTALAGNATASLDASGHLIIAADAAGNGIAINEMDSAVAVVGGETRGLSHYFGLNDVFTANTDNSDYNSFSTAQQRDSTTALGISGTLTFTGSFGTGTAAYATTDSLEDIAATINGTAGLSTAGIEATVIDDGTGRRLKIIDSEGNNFLMKDSANFLSTIGMAVDEVGISRVLAVSDVLVSDPALLARGALNDSATLAAGDIGLTIGDGSITHDLSGAFDANLSFAASGGLAAASTTLGRYAANILSVQASLTSTATSALEFNEQFLETLQFRSQGVSGVNIDEELSQIIILEQSFNASARIVTTVAEMLDQLIATIR